MTYTASYLPLDDDRPESGQVRTLPWDHAIFGFPVGEYLLTDPSYYCRNSKKVTARLDLWAAGKDIRLVSCESNAKNFESIRLLQEHGFHYVDTSLNAVTYNVKALKIPPVKLPIRLAQPSDRDAIAAIAYGSFLYGRYHQDSAFPFRLACERYRKWIHNAMDTLGTKETGERIYVFTVQEVIAGFFHLIVDGTEADLRLAGVDARYQGSIYGVGLFSQTFMQLREEGINKISAKISAINTDIVNLYGAMGFKFSDPVTIFHRHYGQGKFAQIGMPSNSNETG